MIAHICYISKDPYDEKGATDRLIEFISLGGHFLNTRIGRVKSRYVALIDPIRGVKEKLGIYVLEPKNIKSIHLYYLKWLLKNPLSLANPHVDIVIIYKSKFEPSTQSLLAAKSTYIGFEAEICEKSCNDIYLSAIATAIIEPVRMGISLTTSIINSLIFVASYLNESIVRNSIELAALSLLTKLTQTPRLIIESGIGAKYPEILYEESAFRALLNDLNKLLTEIRTRKTCLEISRAISLTNTFNSIVFGKYGENVKRNVEKYVITDPKHASKSMVDSIERNVNDFISRAQECNVLRKQHYDILLFDVTESTSLVDLYVAGYLAESLGINEIYLTYTPQTLPIIMLLDLFSYDFDTLLHYTDDNKFLLNVGNRQYLFKPLMISASDPWILEPLLRKILEKKNGRDKNVLYIVGSTPIALLVALKLKHELGTLDVASSRELLAPQETFMES